MPIACYSIDQNSHSLWDVLPKLLALSAAGYPTLHCIEDVDTAFTAIGAGEGAPLQLRRERYYRGGGADWGAALFYTELLGRLPVDVRRFEPCTGLSTKALAKELGLSVDELYDRYSPADNHQLIGGSYLFDRDHHRVIGDLRTAETAAFCREILELARRDLHARLPSATCRGRIEAWFSRERQTLEALLARHAGGRLVELYRDWLGGWTNGRCELSETSRLLAPGADRHREALIEAFCRDYDRLAAMYNEALAETDVGLRPLEIDAGELPVFAVLERDGRQVRTTAHLQDGSLVIGERRFGLGRSGELPHAQLREAGVIALAGKAVLLVLQVRCGPHGRALALPHRGSQYLPAARLLERRLREAGLLPGDLAAVLRVRMGFLDLLRDCREPIRLPAHLAAAMGAEEVPADELGRNWAALADDARQRLHALTEKDRRAAWQRRALPEPHEQLDELDRLRRQQAREDPKAPRMRELSHQAGELKNRILRETLEQIDRDVQVRELDYYDSRGALVPWAHALGGETMVSRLIEEARIHEEPLPTTR